MLTNLVGCITDSGRNRREEIGKGRTKTAKEKAG
jgi:hypothetical protein